MIFTGIRVRNFLRYRGEFELALGPGCYAARAARQDGNTKDESRSNYQGKTSFMRALLFLVSGDAGTATEDEWITHGEDEGEVEGEFDDGTFVSRFRPRGGPTQLEVTRPGMDPKHPLLGKAAQQELDTLVLGNGSKAREHLATWWCGQKQADYFATAEASELTEMVAGWVGIVGVRKAHELARDELTRLLKEQGALLKAQESWTADLSKQRSLEELQHELAVNQANLRATEALVAAEQNAVAEVERRRELEQKARRYEQIRTDIAKLESKTRVVVTLEQLRASAAVTKRGSDVARDAERNEQQLRQALRGAFSGKCPVDQVECPRKQDINQGNDRTRGLHEQARAKLGEAATAYAELRASDEQLRSNKTQNEKDEQALTQLRQQLEYYERAAAEWKEIASGETRRVSGLDMVSLLKRDRDLASATERAIAHRGLIQTRANETADKLKELAPQLQGHREAVALLGPAGVQRRLARAMLDEVEDEGNAALERVAVDLTVNFRWERETGQPNDACEVCGAPFPSSRKIKACVECAAPRGLKKEQRLHTVIDPHSGGADDIAGLVARFAVARWLRKKRGVDWGVLCLDEPFGHLDSYNTRAMSQLIQTLALEAGFTQVFVVSHGRFEAPRQIQILGGANGSTVQVIDAG